MLRLGILASGGGSNFQSILDAFEAGKLGNAEPALLVVDRPCKAADRGRSAGLPVRLLDRKTLKGSLSKELGKVLEEYRIDMVALAGWLSILDSSLTGTWAGRILNIHPSLLPKFGGMGMYGIKVHEAVLGDNEKESGCSVHLVSEVVDEGEILGQTRVEVKDDDTPESLAGRILVEEHRLYPRIIAEYAKDLPVLSR